jgi:hypothetical protein
VKKPSAGDALFAFAIFAAAFAQIAGSGFLPRIRTGRFRHT